MAPLSDGAGAGSLAGRGGVATSSGRLDGGSQGSRLRSNSLGGCGLGSSRTDSLLGRGGGTGTETSADLGARHSVRRRTAVDVEVNALVIGLVDRLDVGTVGDALGARRSDGDLTATVVELSLAQSVALVKSNDLRADEVVTSGKVGDSDINLSGVAAELLNSPLAVTQTILLDLDPGVALTLSASLRNPNDDGTVVRL